MFYYRRGSGDLGSSQEIPRGSNAPNISRTAIRHTSKMNYQWSDFQTRNNIPVPGLSNTEKAPRTARTGSQKTLPL